MSTIKGYAVLRTAENAKEVNEWMNRKTAFEPTGIYNMSDGYIHMTAHNTFCVWAHIQPNYELCPDFTTFKERVEAVDGKKEMLTAVMTKSSKDWQEDFSHENGNYLNTCMFCKGEFLGHKRRVVCKECDTKRVGAMEKPEEGNDLMKAMKALQEGKPNIARNFISRYMNTDGDRANLESELTTLQSKFKVMEEIVEAQNNLHQYESNMIREAGTAFPASIVKGHIERIEIVTTLTETLNKLKA